MPIDVLETMTYINSCFLMATSGVKLWGQLFITHIILQWLLIDIERSTRRRMFAPKQARTSPNM